MADNFNINTTQAQSYAAGGLDANDPSQNVGDMIANNQLKQQEQEQLVKQAVERTKQAQMSTKVDEEGGLEAGKGLVPKAQALTDLHAAAESSDLDDAAKAKIIAEAEETWPDVVSADAIHRMVNALHPQKESKLGEGAAFAATGTEKDQNGTPFKKGTVIQEIATSGGDPIYVHSAIPVDHSHDHDNSTLQKRKTDLVNRIAAQLAAKRGNWLSQGLYRCSTEAQRLNHTAMLTKQDLKQISIGLAAVFTGGVPSEDEVLSTEYGNEILNIKSRLNSWTGQVTGLPLDEIRQKLSSIIDGLNRELVSRFTGLMDFEAQGYLDVTEGDPQWWADTRKKALDAAEHKENPSIAVQGVAGHNLTPGGPSVDSGNQISGGQPAANPHDPMGIL